MENRAVAALVSLLVSQALLLFSLPVSAAATAGASTPNPNPLLLLHLLSSHEIAAAAPFLLPRKRKRLPNEAYQDGPGAAVAASPISVLRRQPDHFRLGLGMAASTFEWLAGLLEPLLDCPTAADGQGRIPAAARLALGLSHLATGAPYADLAARFALPEAAARSCARRLRRVLCTNFRFWLAFPSSSADRQSVSTGFQSLPGGGLPGCCGAVACARFDVGEGVAAQVLADASCRILHIAAGFRGEQTDSRVLKRSSLHRDGEAGRLLNSAEQYLVGGRSYPLLPWLMVPYNEAAAKHPQEDFNAVHRAMLQPARRTIASLRNWGILSSPTAGEEDARAAAACVATCAILHNVMLMRDDCSALAAEEVDGEDWSVPEAAVVAEGLSVEAKSSALRDALAEKAGEVRRRRRPGESERC